MGAPAFADKTEYAVRWDPDKTGPKSAAAAAVMLQIQDDKPKEFEVRYLTVTEPPGLPGPNFQVVARERTDKDGPEAMYKVRGPDSAEARKSLSKWSCPLKGKQDSKLEVDVGWVTEEKDMNGPTVVREAISYSCSVEGAASAAYPKDFGMTPKPCVNKVTRLKQEDKAKNLTWKVEEWALPTGGRIVELSYSVDAGSPAQRAAFQEKVDILLKERVVPLPGSKTVMGSTCPP
jgi:hypothetical protein